MKKFFGWLFAIILVLAVIAILVSVETLIFMFLWNWIVGGLIGWVTLTFWQSLGVMVLLDFIGALLFK